MLGVGLQQGLAPAPEKCPLREDTGLLSTGSSEEAGPRGGHIVVFLLINT